MPLTALIYYFNDRLSHSDLLPPRPLALCDGLVVGRFARVLLSTAFQAVVRARDPECVIGHEALLRAYTGSGQPVTPEALLGVHRSPHAAVYLDRLCRMVHMLKYLSQRETRQGPLFLNVGTEHLLRVPDDHGWYFEQVLQRCGLAPRHVVIDVQASALQDAHTSQVCAGLANYRARGYGIAIQGLDLAASVFDLLWQVPADFVKIDVGTLLNAVVLQRSRLRRLVKHTTIEIIATGIETLEQARAVCAIEIDGLQGFYFSAPEEGLEHLERRDRADRAPSPDSSASARVPPTSVRGRLQFCC